MITIKDFDTCLQYVNRVGAIKTSKFPGWIPAWQERACNLCDDMRSMSGQDTWYHKEFKPFKAHYNREQNSFTVTYFNTDVVAGTVYATA